MVKKKETKKRSLYFTNRRKYWESKGRTPNKKIERKPRINIKIVELGKRGQKKGRVGKYYYVKEPKKSPKYYKYKEDIRKKDILEYYKRGITSKRGGIQKKRLLKEIKLDKKLKEYPKIDSILESGYAEYTIRNIGNLTPSRTRDSYRFLLMNKDGIGDGKGIVRDRELMDIITRQENVQKWVHRIGYDIKIKNQNGEIMFSINNEGVKGLGDIKKEIIDEIKLGSDYNSNYRKLEKIRVNGWRVNQGTTKQGRIRNIDVKMIFRKA